MYIGKGVAGCSEKERYTYFFCRDCEGSLCEEKIDMAFRLVTTRRACFFWSGKGIKY